MSNPMKVAVQDAAGRLVAFAGEDGSSLVRERIARGKAHGALNMGVGGRSLAARAASNPAFVNSLVSLADGNLVPGGVLIRDDDEACAIHGIAAAGLRAAAGAADPT
jgi:uncharacterized protein GlcG (DUF336 family)